MIKAKNMEGDINDDFELEKTEIISPDLKDLQILEGDGWRLYGVNEPIYKFSRWRLKQKA